MENRPSLALENISLGVIVKIVCDQMQLSHDKIPSDSQSRRVSLARSMVAYFAHYHAKYSYEDIAAVVCRTPNSIGKTLRRYLKLASSDREIRSLFNGIEKKLSISDMDRWVS
jgi:chromosomal replication initiation ATPase DnaA